VSAPEAGRPSLPAPVSRALLTLALHELRLTLRRGESLLVTIGIPAVVLVFFSTAAVLPERARSVDFLVPGAITLAIVATGLVNLGIATAYERSYGVLKRLAAAPVPRWAILGGKAGAVVVVELFQVVLLVAVAMLVLGWTPGPGFSPLVVAAGLALGTLTFAALGLGIAGILSAPTTLAAANGLFVLFLIVGGIVLPVDHLPGPLAPIASALPAAPLSEALRIGLGHTDADPVPSLALLAAWAAGAAVLAARRFRWE
jgi:ABC-2 type transport system permease protein